MKYADFGSISSGTLRTEDLLSAFADELEYQIKRQPRSYHHKDARKLINEARRTKPDSDIASDVVAELEDALEEFAPPYCYFGSHVGDGADFGYWVSDDVFDAHGDCCDILRVSDTSEVPKDYRGEVLHVNDHGNATLYVAMSRGKLKEIWACV
jgi:hypothetical protein